MAYSAAPPAVLTRRGTTAALAAAIGLYLLLVLVLAVLSLARTGGDFVYAQDDPYIHLAIARTLAEHGTWGIQPGEFASASSSPLWTVLLAGLWAAGAQAVWVPFALNVLCGIGVLAVARRHAREADAGPRSTLVFLFAIVLVTPLPALAFIGMEHTLQVLLVLAFALHAARVLARPDAPVAPAAVLAALMAATRYESLFLVAAVGGLLVWQGRLRPALAIGAAAAAPLLLFAWYSVAHGGLVLPNSVLMKSGPGRFGSVGQGIAAVLNDWVAILNLYGRPPQSMLTLGVLGALLFSGVTRVGDLTRAHWLALVFLGTSILHACLVKLEWFFRYEAYLMALGCASLLALSPWLSLPRVERRKRWHLHPALVGLLILLALPLATRSLSALASVAGAVRNVYEQQIQMARFFGAHYAGQTVALNDIGAPAWQAEFRILDVVGLASQEVADLKRRRALTAGELERLVRERDAAAIALYEDVFAPILPERWVKVGEWTVPVNVAVSGRTVAFFAPSEAEASRLRESLRTFAEQLPDGVTWTETNVRLPGYVAAP